MVSSADDIDSDILEHGMFPSEEDFKLALRFIREWNEHDARELLRSLLMRSTSLGVDDRNLRQMSRDSSDEDITESRGGEYWRRLNKYAEDKSAIKMLRTEDDEDDLPEAVPPWEGITWTLDLLQDSPHRALQVIEAYMETHIWLLPDGRLKALEDAAVLIRARYIGLPEHTEDRIALLLERHPRDLEIITAWLYEAMGYRVRVTKRTRDGGFDVVATRHDPGRREDIRIECKRTDRTVGVAVVDRLLGVVSKDKVNKGVVVVTSRFSPAATAAARDNPRLDLVDGTQLVLLLNEHLGSDWPLHIERLSARPPTAPEE